MKVRFLGAHNTESRQTKMAALVIDGLLAIDAGGLTSGLSFRAQEKLKALLITHQHYDHIRDLPALAMNLSLRESSISVYSTRPVHEALKKYLFDGRLYPNFFEPRDDKTVLSFKLLEPHRSSVIEGYTVLPVPVIHPVPTVGYEVMARRGQTLFYTGDTGPGLYETWRHVSPHLLIIEVTVSNRFDDFAKESSHLSPNLLKEELSTFKELKGYLPRVVTVHMNPDLEREIGPQVEAVASELGADITMAHEGLEIELEDPMA